MGECQCRGIEATFDRDLALDQVDRLRKHGPQKTTRLLLEALRSRGVAGRSILDIGGGIGVIQHELLAAGASGVTSVDASPAYLSISRSEARHFGWLDRISYHGGDFVRVAPSIPPADIVTLDRVICCYDDMEALVSASAARALHLYGLVFPRSSWWVRLGTGAANATLWLRRSQFRIFTHRTRDVEAVIAAQGLSRVYRKASGMWQVVVYARTR